jgi:hypothetical protein
MNDIKNPPRYQGVDRRSPPPDAPGSAAAYGGVGKRAEKIGGRHGAITNTLYNWHSYKNWADKMRGGWEDKK